MTAFSITSGNQTVTGTESDDFVSLDGNGGSNVLINLLGGNDQVQSTAVYTNVTVNGNQGTDTIQGIGGQSFIFGQQGDDQITLNIADQIGISAFGGAGVDTINVDAGTGHLIFGNLDNDTINIGTGGITAPAADSVFGGQGIDTITVANGLGATNLFISGDLGDDVIAANDLANSQLFGGAGNDTFTSAGANVSIFGGQDADIITASGKGDILFGNKGVDTITFSGASNSVFGGQGNDTITFNAQVNGDKAFISGDLGNDILSAKAAGSYGATLVGGDGNDIFQIEGALGNKGGVIGGASTSLLRVGDFKTGVDKIDAATPVNFTSVQTNDVTDVTTAEARAEALFAQGFDTVFIAGKTDGYFFQGSAAGFTTEAVLTGGNTLGFVTAADIV